MNQFFSISSLPLNIVFLAAYLFAAVFGIGVHAHETLSHHHHEIDEHAHHFVLHAHNDLSGSNATPVIVAEDNDHEHDVPTLQLSGVHNSSLNQKFSTQTTTIVRLAIETLRVNRNDYIVAILLAASPPLQSHSKSHHIGRAPPTV